MLTNLDTAIKIVDTYKKNNRKVVFTNGCFDIIHAGHVRYLTEAKKLGDILIIGLNSDESVRKLKGETRPVNTIVDRAEVLFGLKPVDYVIEFKEETPKNLIYSIIPDVLVKGADYKIEDIVGYDTVTKNGGIVTTIKFVEGKSTTNIINRMK